LAVKAESVMKPYRKSVFWEQFVIKTSMHFCEFSGQKKIKKNKQL